MDDVVLGHVAHPTPEGVVLRVQARVAVADVALGRHLEPGQRSHERRLARAGRADDAEQRLRVEREGHVLEQHPHTRNAHREAQGGVDHLAGVDVLPEGVPLEPERVPADHEHVPGRQRLPLHAPPVHEGAVVAAHVDDLPPTSLDGADLRVAPRDEHVVDDEVAVRGAPDQQPLAGQGDEAGAMLRRAVDVGELDCAVRLHRTEVARQQVELLDRRPELDERPVLGVPQPQAQRTVHHAPGDALAVDEDVLVVDRLDDPAVIRVPEDDVPGSHAVTGDANEAASVGADDDLRQSGPEHRLAIRDP